MLLRKLITGGRSGVEAGVAQAAKAFGFPCVGRRSSKPLTERNDKFRAAWNVVHSDASLVIPNARKTDICSSAVLTDHECFVGKCCVRRKKPFHIEMRGDADRTYRWLENEVAPTCATEKPGAVLYVTGPSEKEANGIQPKADRFMRRLLKLHLRRSPNWLD